MRRAVEQSIPSCDHCGGDLIGKYLLYELDGETAKLHRQCKLGYIDDRALECDYCGKQMRDGYSRCKSDRLQGKVHPECVGSFTTDRSIVSCDLCKYPINKEKVTVEVDGKKLVVHARCEIELNLNCSLCNKPVNSEGVTLSDPLTFGQALLHPHCVNNFKQIHFPICGECGSQILCNKYTTLGGQSYHDECVPE